ncbi:MAG: hypothetical protein PVSMB7_25340 [Chloroflexota bacterium]
MSTSALDAAEQRLEQAIEFIALKIAEADSPEKTGNVSYLESFSRQIKTLVDARQAIHEIRER